MNSSRHSISVRFFDRVVLQYPRTTVALLVLAVGILALRTSQFRLEASADTLVLENDADLRYAREISERYGEQDLLVLIFTPPGELFADESLENLRRLRDDLRGLEPVASVRTILDVPLIQAAAGSVENLREGIPTLESGQIDRPAAVAELRDSSLYRDLLVSADGETTALLVTLHQDAEYQSLIARRDGLRTARAAGTLSAAARAELHDLDDAIAARADDITDHRHATIAAIRDVMARHQDDARLFLGGVSMIADDMISFIRSDLRIFGIGGAVALAVVLGVVFRIARWVMLPMLCCALSAVAMIGLLGWLRWPVTVISANFIALQLIMTMALAIHLVVQYRELLARHPQASHRDLVLDAVAIKFRPCVFAVLTTMAGFGSLLLCDILPVIMLGRMMMLGMVVSLIVSFLLFPAVLVLLPKTGEAHRVRQRTSLTVHVARLTERSGPLILGVNVALLIAGIIGITRLKVENRFIDYFGAGTEINKGMKVIDAELGGTTPLDVILRFEDRDATLETGEPTTAPADDDFDDFAAFDDLDSAATADKYWFTQRKLSLVRAAHEYLDSLPDTGKVLSLATALDVAEQLKHGKPLDSFDLALLYSETPDEFRELLVDPYASIARNEARLHLRVVDSSKTLRRDDLLRRIEAELPARVGLPAQNVRVAGLLVLYNNMLQSLFDSQILTLGVTALLLSAMLWMLFRSWRVTLLALAPNLLPVVVVLGFMGWMDMPLDMMTITIAAIGVGIAVDDTVHYLHRYREEIRADADGIQAMHRSHASVGLAMYYTTATITIGFAMLAFSNFIPTVRFGLLTGLAMVVALLADLTLLPRLLILFRPFADEKPDAGAGQAS